MTEEPVRDRSNTPPHNPPDVQGARGRSVPSGPNSVLPAPPSPPPKRLRR